MGFRRPCFFEFVRSSLLLVSGLVHWCCHKLASSPSPQFSVIGLSTLSTRPVSELSSGISWLNHKPFRSPNLRRWSPSFARLQLGPYTPTGLRRFDTGGPPPSASCPKGCHSLVSLPNTDPPLFREQPPCLSRRPQRAQALSVLRTASHRSRSNANSASPREGLIPGCLVLGAWNPPCFAPLQRHVREADPNRRLP